MSWRRNRGGVQHNDELPTNVAGWLHIAPDGNITAFTGKVEVGQNIRTSLTQAVADELLVSPNMVILVWEIPRALLGTWARSAAERHRHGAGDAQDGGDGARSADSQAAKEMGNAERTTCGPKDGVFYASIRNQSASYGDLASKIDWVNIIGNADLVTASHSLGSRGSRFA